MSVQEIMSNDPIVNDLLKKGNSGEADALEADALEKTVIHETKTIIVRNLPREMDNFKICRIFEEYGPICDVYIPKNMNINSKYYGTVKGFAVIKFVSLSTAKNACMNAPTYIYGNRVTVEYAKQDK